MGRKKTTVDVDADVLTATKVLAAAHTQQGAAWVRRDPRSTVSVRDWLTGSWFGCAQVCSTAAGA